MTGGDGREADLIARFIMPFAVADRTALCDHDILEFARTFARKAGWTGAGTLYGSMLREGADLRALSELSPIRVPTLAVDRAGSTFTRDALRADHDRAVRHVQIDGVGHYTAQEAPETIARALLALLGEADDPEQSRTDAELPGSTGAASVARRRTPVCGEDSDSRG